MRTPIASLLTVLALGAGAEVVSSASASFSFCPPGETIVSASSASISYCPLGETLVAGSSAATYFYPVGATVASASSAPFDVGPRPPYDFVLATGVVSRAATEDAISIETGNETVTFAANPNGGELLGLSQKIPVGSDLYLDMRISPTGYEEMPLTTSQTALKSTRGSVFIRKVLGVTVSLDDKFNLWWLATETEEEIVGETNLYVSVAGASPVKLTAPGYDPVAKGFDWQRLTVRLRAVSESRMQLRFYIDEIALSAENVSDFEIETANEVTSVGFKGICQVENLVITFAPPFDMPDATPTSGEFLGVYDGLPHGITVPPHWPSTADVSYAHSPDGPFVPFSDDFLFTSVCKTNVWYKFSASDYADCIHAAKVTITNRCVTLTSGTKLDFVYDGQPHSNSHIIISESGFVAGEGIATSNWATVTTVAEGEVANTFDYAPLAGTKLSNYAISVVTGKIAVVRGAVDLSDDPGKVDPTVDPSDPGQIEDPAIKFSPWDYVGMYDGASHTVDTNALRAAYAAVVGEGLSIGFMDTQDGVAGVCALPPTFRDVVATSFWYKVTSPNYADIVHPCKVTVTNRPVTVTSADGIWAYDGKEHATNAVVVTVMDESGPRGARILPGGLIELLEGETVETTFYKKWSEVGVEPNAFSIAWTGTAKEANYVVTLVTGKLEIVSASTAVGDYASYDLVRDLGVVIDADTSAGDVVTIKAEGLVKGMSIAKDRATGRWLLSGVPSETVDYATQPIFVRVTVTYADRTKGKSETLQLLPLAITSAVVRELPMGTAGTVYEPLDIATFWPEVADAAENPQKWSFRGWPSGIRYNSQNRDQAWRYKVAGVTHKTNVAPYSVYGLPTVPGTYLLTATYKRLLADGKTTVSEFKTGSLTIWPSPDEQTYRYTDQVGVPTQTKRFSNARSVSGLPQGIRFSKGIVSGTPTKAGVYAVTVAQTDRTKDVFLWQVTAGANEGVLGGIDWSATSGVVLDRSCAVMMQGAVKGWQVPVVAGAKVSVTGLPAGLALASDRTTGMLCLTGTPTKVGNYVVTFKTVQNNVTVTERIALVVTSNAWTGTWYGVQSPVYEKSSVAATVAVAAGGTVKLILTENALKTTVTAKNLSADGASAVFTLPRNRRDSSSVVRLCSVDFATGELSLDGVGIATVCKPTTLDLANGTALTYNLVSEDAEGGSLSYATIKATYNARRGQFGLSGKLWDGTAIRGTVYPVAIEEAIVLTPVLVTSKSKVVVSLTLGDVRRVRENGTPVPVVVSD